MNAGIAMTILKANGDEYRTKATPRAILTADGDDYNPPTVLTSDEFDILRKAFGLSRRNQTTITRRVLRLGKPDEATSALLNLMAEQGLVKLYIDTKGLSKKAAVKVKAGDLSAGKLIAEVTQRGAAAFFETVRQARIAAGVAE